ncbi:MAG: ParA family protein [Alphaproteobacteria bacterium]|nr:ParA family protein [Alphaproteobacteria bacterium]
MNKLPLRIIAFASPKGGVGKSTMCACLASVLASRGHQVTVLDIDQNRTLHQWALRFPQIQDYMNIAPVDGDQLIEKVRGLYQTTSGYLLIDVAGAFQTATIAAATIADLTITPAKPSAPDIIEAVKLNREIRQLAQKIGKTIDHRILINGVSPIWPTYQRAAMGEIERAGLTRLATCIHDRAAYAEMFLTGQPPHYADETRNPIAKARNQLDELADEVLQIFAARDVQEAA